MPVDRERVLAERLDLPAQGAHELPLLDEPRRIGRIEMDHHGNEEALHLERARLA